MSDGDGNCNDIRYVPLSAVRSSRAIEGDRVLDQKEGKLVLT